jgi:hypothetical protein
VLRASSGLTVRYSAQVDQSHLVRR